MICQQGGREEWEDRVRGIRGLLEIADWKRLEEIRTYRNVYA